MKTFYSMFAILLSIFCIIYLLFYPKSDTGTAHKFSAKVLAKEVVSDEHNTPSDAFVLSQNQVYQKKLSAHNTFYGCISSKRNITFFVTSKAINKLKITLFSDTGKMLSFNTQLSGNTRTLSFSNNTENNSQRIFCSIFNQSTTSCSFQIKLQTTVDASENTTQKETNKNDSKAVANYTAKKTDNNKNTTSKSKKQSASETKNDISNAPKKIVPKTDSLNNTSTKSHTTSDSKHSTSNKQSLSTIHSEKPVLYPQFVLATEDSVYNLSVKTDKKKCSLSHFTFLSSNPSVAIIKENKVYALQEGIAIIYIQDKRNLANTSSCFIRVIN